MTHRQYRQRVCSSLMQSLLFQILIKLISLLVFSRSLFTFQRGLLNRQVQLCLNIKIVRNTFMSDQESHAAEQLPKGKEESERKFGCPCGKWYLSYPALFTHVKQKHDGKAPGALIKPKTDKARGRPRLPTSNVEQDQSILNYDCQQQLEKALMNKSCNYTQNYEMSDGSESCQDMGSNFIRSLSVNGEEKSLLNCFLNYLRFFVRRKYHQNYWETNKPTDIIDISNEIVRDLQLHKTRFPLDKETLIDLLYVLFRWMYKNKWTDHKLVKRTAQAEPNKESNKENCKES